MLMVLFSETIKEFKVYVTEENEDTVKMAALRAKVNEFASQYNMPGLDDR